jgi:excisionase family DNA binding protein
LTLYSTYIIIVLEDNKRGKTMKIYNSKEVAGKLDIHITSVLKLINSGELPAKKVARKWRVTENQLREYLEGNSIVDNIKEEN